MDWQALAADPLSVVPVIWGTFVSGVLTGTLAVLVTLIYRSRR
jgi:uncharacterized membrane protein